MEWTKKIPATIRRILLWGVPSVSLLGLIGIVGWRWLYSNGRKNAGVKKVAGSTTAASQPEDVYAHSPSSGVDGGKQGPTSRMDSEEDLRVHSATPFMVRSRGKQMTSSNIYRPLMESETPLKPPDTEAISGKPSDTFSTEVDSSLSSEGLLSFSSKYPGDHENSETVPQFQPEFTKWMKCSNGPSPSTDETKHSQSEIVRNVTEAKSLESTKSTPFMGRRDRVRVMIQIPRDLVGRFIGKQGKNIKSLMVDSDGAYVYINQKNLPKSAEVVSCAVQGTSKQVEEALRIIEMKHPEIEIPGLWSSSNPLLQHASPIPSPLPNSNGGESWDLELLPAFIPSTSFSAMVCYIESVNDVWLVSCEKSVELDEQHQSMSYTYCYATATGKDYMHANEEDKNLLGKFCAVRVSEIHWLRGCITRFGDNSASYEVQLMDYGSTVVVPPSSIRPLRREHCQLPIQAFKSRLAHVEPKEASSETGLVSLQQLVEGMILEVHITGFLDNDSMSSSPASAESSPSASMGSSALHANKNESPTSVRSDTGTGTGTPNSAGRPLNSTGRIPMVELYTQLGAQTPTFINRELVELGYATWKEEKDS